MIIYENEKAGFLRDAFTSDIEDVVRSQFHQRTGRNVGLSEFRSWRESLVAVAKVVNDEVIPGDSRVGIEYQIPQTSKRIDFLLSGQDARKRDQLFIIELKQWEHAARTNKDGIVVTRFGSGDKECPHPSYQAWSYASLLQNFNEAVFEGQVDLFPCAYLHNCGDSADLTDSFYADYLERAPVFCKGAHERTRLRECIRSRIERGDGNRILQRIDGAPIRPAKQLIEALSGMLAGNPEFVLIDDQKVAYETALDAARNATVSSKRIVIIEGGPGTGKSIVAINLLVALTANGLVAKYVTKNRAPRQVFESRLTGTRRRSEISMLFGGSGEFTETEPNAFDALIVDEAHRLNEKSGLFGNLGEHQIKEIISAARCAVFFIDEDQRVTWKDVGSKEAIRSRAPKRSKIVSEALASQFRCNGSDGYLAWLDDALGIRETANRDLDTRDFDFRLFESVQELWRVIVERNHADNKARMVAGYCWDWKSRKDPRAVDVVIPHEEFGMQWNFADDEGRWIISPTSVNQIGCIHTCQGLELDYVGVIVGPDLTVQDGRVMTHASKRSRQDQSLHGYKKLFAIDPKSAYDRADILIKNTYRTLMTRGLKGCYVYCVDPGAREHFKARLGRASQY
jgi:DUF2075 family protein